MVTIFPLYLPAGARFLAFLPVLEYATISVHPSHFSFSSRLPFPFLLSDTPLNVFARANFHCYPSYKLRLGRVDCQIRFSIVYFML